jgi:hypothetical protein
MAQGVILRQTASNEFYQIAVDVRNNRLHIAAAGHWQNSAKVRDLPYHVAEAVEHLRPGFTALVDLRRARLLSARGPAAETQRILAQSTLGKLATVFDRHILTEIQIGLMAKGAGEDYLMKRRVFHDLEQAIEWLDRPDSPPPATSQGEDQQGP